MTLSTVAISKVRNEEEKHMRKHMQKENRNGKIEHQHDGTATTLKTFAWRQHRRR